LTIFFYCPATSERSVEAAQANQGAAFLKNEQLQQSSGLQGDRFGVKKFKQ
jgi:hypothetical protein